MNKAKDVTSYFQFNFICIASIKMQVVSRRSTETQSMTTEQISLPKIIILNPNQRKMAKKTPLAEKKTCKTNSGKEKLHEVLQESTTN